MGSPSRSTFLIGAVAVALLLPAVVTGLGPVGSGDPPLEVASNATHQGVTFISTQGGSSIDLPSYDTTIAPFGQGRLVAIDTATGRVRWSHTGYTRYYDVDPLGPDRLLFVGIGDGRTYGVLYDWRADRQLDRFEIPVDSHDVDALGDGRYAVADILNDRLYVYDARNGTETWVYRFGAHYPPYPEAGGSSFPGEGYTHVNDIDPVDDGRALLVSPRNFNRVLLINRTTKAAELRLGSQENTSILQEQHNPTLLSREPPTVLVADSENDRVVEYARSAEEWHRTWAYGDGLAWPRDAERLPSGNTLIVDTYHQRVVEVTPAGDVVWAYHIAKMPYDVERLRPGNDPAGPTMATIADAPAPGPPPDTDPLRAGGRRVYHLSIWLLPARVGPVEFGLLVFGLTLLGGIGLSHALGRLRGRLRPPEP